MSEVMTAREAVSRLVQIQKHDVNLRGVLGHFKPNHTHWRTRLDLPSDLAAIPGTLSRADLTAYLFCQGLESFVLGDNADPFGNRGGVAILPEPGADSWNPENAVRLFSEIDFGIDFGSRVLEYPSLGVIRGVSISLNTSRVAGGEDEGRYRAHLIGYPLNPDGKFRLIRKGDRYLERIDKHLKKNGVDDGIDVAEVTEESRRLIICFQENLLPRAA